MAEASDRNRGGHALSTEDNEALFDAVPFPCAPMSESSPDHLAALAHLYGLHPAGLDGARVLEIACATGENLIPHALARPDSHYVGIDLSAGQLAMGQARIDALGLQNIELIQANLLDLPGELGLFDTILCTGVWSWVPEPVRVAIEELLSRHLTPNGVVFLNFNAYPGWYYHEPLRVMLRRHTADCRGLEQVLERSRELLTLLQGSFGLDRGGAAELWFDRLQSGGESYLLHEYLTPDHRAFWFDELMGRLGNHGLRFVTTAWPGSAVPESHPAEVAQAVAGQTDAIAVQQQLDYATMRPYHSVLLARDTGPFERVIEPERAWSLWFSTQASIDGEHRYTTPDGRSAVVTSAPTRAAIAKLTEAWPRALPFSALSPDSAPEAERRQLAVDLLWLMLGGVLRVHTGCPTVATELSEHPEACPLARLQAAEQSWVTSRWHEMLQLSPEQSALIQQLDGTCAVAQLEAAEGQDVREDLRFLLENAVLVG